MSTTQLQKMQAGRERAKKARDRERLPRLAAYRDWLKADTAWYALHNAGLNAGPKPRMPKLPSHDDYVYERLMNGEDVSEA